MRILGIDPGIVNIGLAGYNTNTDEIEYTEYQRVEPDLAAYYEEFKTFISSKDIDLICYEKPNNNEGFLRTKKYGMMEVLGVQRLVVEQLAIDIVHLTPTNVKKLFTGRGNASKDDIKEEVDRRFGLNQKNNHINDAIAIACSWHIKKHVTSNT